MGCRRSKKLRIQRISRESYNEAEWQRGEYLAFNMLVTAEGGGQSGLVAARNYLTEAVGHAQRGQTYRGQTLHRLQQMDEADGDPACTQGLQRQPCQAEGDPKTEVGGDDSEDDGCNQESSIQVCDVPIVGNRGTLHSLSRIAFTFLIFQNTINMLKFSNDYY